jgi:hypothetical protein
MPFVQVKKGWQSPASQGSPTRACSAHTPFLQKRAGAQSASVVSQASPSCAYGTHAGVPLAAVQRESAGQEGVQGLAVQVGFMGVGKLQTDGGVQRPSGQGSPAPGRT